MNNENLVKLIKEVVQTNLKRKPRNKPRKLSVVPEDGTSKGTQCVINPTIETIRT